jgi:hypothetical protein
VPPPLSRLSRAVERGDGLLAACDIALLTSLDPVEARYGAELAAGSDDAAATVRAHRRVFERLGFFAEDSDGCFLALDLATGPADDPPVVHLDPGGRYQWLGRDLGEALLRHAHLRGQLDAMAAWLGERAFRVRPLPAIGATTQFLPDLAKLHERWRDEERGAAQPAEETDGSPAAPDDPMSWLLRPGPEVAVALAALLGLAPGAVPPRQWVGCDGEGRVVAIWFRRVKAAASARVLGFGHGARRADVEAALGPPIGRRSGWLRYARGPRAVTFRFEDDLVSDISLTVQRLS